MNDMNQLEKQLRSWVPRRPSPKLEERLFARAHATLSASADTLVASPAGPGFRLHWLAPATAALVFLCVMFNQRYGPSMGDAANPRPFLALISSNQSFAAFSVAGGHNGPPADTFEWTNGSGSTSSIGPLLPARAQD